MKNYYLDRATEKEESKPEESFVYIISNELNQNYTYTDWTYSSDYDGPLPSDYYDSTPDQIVWNYSFDTITNC